MALKTSLGIWAFGSMITRFVPVGYQPQWTSENTVDKIKRAVAGLGGLIDDYEFHYPYEINEENDQAQELPSGATASTAWRQGSHLDPLFGRGGLCSPDASSAEGGRAAHALAAADMQPANCGRTSSSGPESKATTTPSRRLTVRAGPGWSRGHQPGRPRCKDHGIQLFLEHKNSEPAMKILMRNIGMTLHVIHKLRTQGLDNVKVNMDWQHLLMNGENLGEYAGDAGWRGAPWPLTCEQQPGALSTTTTWSAPQRSWRRWSWPFELRRAGYGDRGERLGFDLYPYTEDAIAAVKRSVLQWRFIDSVAERIDDAALARSQIKKGRCPGVRDRI